MKWLEIIRLRTAGDRDELLDEFLRSLAKDNQSSGLVEMKTYRHVALENDVSVHLHWESDRPEQNGTALGHRLAQALKEFGLIDHSIWTENQK